MPSEPGLRVGVTGGIGSGKSTVCGLFATRGRVVISADEIARTIIDSNTSVKSGIRRVFGADAFQENGLLDRARMASLVFQDGRLRKKLDSIVHPVVFRVIEEEISSLPAAKKLPFVIVDAALIYESGLDKHLDLVIVVDASEETRIARIMKRDRIPREEVLRRVRSQMDAAKKASRADLLIRNEGNETGLEAKVAFLDLILGKMFSRQYVR